jgi:hypothetical protein
VADFSRSEAVFSRLGLVFMKSIEIHGFSMVLDDRPRTIENDVWTGENYPSDRSSGVSGSMDIRFPGPM